MKSSIIPLQHNAKLYVCTNKQVKGIFVDINFNAGSINDPKGKQGLAHFCEHAICSFPTKGFQQGWKNANIKVHTLIQTLTHLVLI